MRTMRGLISNRRAALWLPVVVVAIVYLLFFVAILILNGWHFPYTFDDAYIHLALADNIAQGHYGINLSEYSSPASSIIWPFLLTPFALLGIAHLVPLVINFFVTAGCVILLAYIANLALAGMAASKRYRAVVVITLLLAPATNLLALAYMGMEHSLQVFLSLVIVVGLIVERRLRVAAWWLGLAIVLGPLVRYENLALSVPALLYLVWRGHRLKAVLWGAALLIPLAAFSLFLRSLGLGILPSSVIAKSPALLAQGTSKMSSFVLAIWSNIGSGQLLSVALLLLGGYAVLRKGQGDRALAAWASVAIALHMLVAQFAMTRYEIYIWVTAIAMLMYVYRHSIASVVKEQSLLKIGLFLCVAVVLMAREYVNVSILTPIAANNIYEQQYQMHRFAVEYYGAAVAVNDLDWVKYKNSNDVLDIWGLGSPDVLRQRTTSGMSTDGLMKLAAKHNVRLAIIYRGVLPKIPSTWILLGEMSLSKHLVMPARSIVYFYAFDQETAATARAELAAFVKTLPRGVKFTLR